MTPSPTVPTRSSPAHTPIVLQILSLLCNQFIMSSYDIYTFQYMRRIADKTKPYLLLASGGLQEPNHEHIRCGDCQVELQRVQHILLHRQHLLSAVSVVGDEHKILDLGGPDFFVLRCQQHGGHAHQLQILPGNGVDAQVPVDQVGRQVQSFRHQLKLQMNLWGRGIKASGCVVLCSG